MHVRCFECRTHSINAKYYLLFKGLRFGDLPATWTTLFSRMILAIEIAPLTLFISVIWFHCAVCAYSIDPVLSPESPAQ